MYITKHYRIIRQMYLYNSSVPFSHHKEYIVSFSCFLSALGFLELINNMLTTGMVPALYADDEREQIIGSVRKKKQHNKPLTNDPPMTSNNNLGYRDMNYPLDAQMVNILVYDT